MKIQVFSDIKPRLLVNSTTAVRSPYIAFSFVIFFMCVRRIFRLALQSVFASVIYVLHRQLALTLKADKTRGKSEIFQLLNLLDSSPAFNSIQFYSIYFVFDRSKGVVNPQDT